MFTWSPENYVATSAYLFLCDSVSPPLTWVNKTKLKQQHSPAPNLRQRELSYVSSVYLIM